MRIIIALLLVAFAAPVVANPPVPQGDPNEVITATITMKYSEWSALESGIANVARGQGCLAKEQTEEKVASALNGPFTALDTALAAGIKAADDAKAKAAKREE